MTARIFDIKHFAVHDGPGIRTTIFFKGCPLKCVWCHNPESISPAPQLSFLRDKCVDCRRCAEVCDKGVHVFEGRHTLVRERCIHCGKCENACPAEALKLYGKNMTLDEVLSEALEDKDFYSDNGGVTLSGGECLAQSDFCAALLSELKKQGIHTAVDTCGFVRRDSIDKILSYTDLFLYDVKAFDEDVHIKCTGQSNRIILENLEYIASLGKEIEIRIPFVPEYNSDQIEKISKHLAALKSVKRVKVLPYHKYAKGKYLSLDMTDTLPDILPENTEIELVTEIVKSYLQKST